MSANTTLCANVLCANSAKMNNLKLETSSDSSSTTPLLRLSNTNPGTTSANATAAVLELNHLPSSANTDDGDDIGVIQFKGLDSAGNSTTYAAMLAESSAVASGSEEGKMTFNLATTTSGASETVLTLQGGTSAATSTTTIAGSLSLDGGLYSSNGTVTALGTAVALDDGVVQTVDSANDAHKVKVPLAKAAGQLMIIRNVDNAQDAVIRNNADDASLLTLGEGKTAILVSTAAGDNWSGSQVD